MRICAFFLATSLLATTWADTHNDTASPSVLSIQDIEVPVYPPHNQTESVPVYSRDNRMRKSFDYRLTHIYSIIFGVNDEAYQTELDKLKEELYSEFSKSVTEAQLASSDFIAPMKAAWYAERLIRGDCPKELESFKSQSDKLIDMVVDAILAPYNHGLPSEFANPFFELLKEKTKECLRSNYVFNMNISEFLMNLFEYLNNHIACQDLELELSNKNFAPKEIVDLFKCVFLYNELSRSLSEIVNAEFLERLTKDIVTLFNMYDKDSRDNGKPLRFVSESKLPNFMARVTSMLPVVQPTHTFGNYDIPISMRVEEILTKLVSKFESENGITSKSHVEQKDLIEALRNFFEDYFEGKVPIRTRYDSMSGFIKAIFEHYENPENINTAYAKVLNAYITEKRQVKTEL